MFPTNNREAICVLITSMRNRIRGVHAQMRSDYFKHAQRVQ